MTDVDLPLSPTEIPRTGVTSRPWVPESQQTPSGELCAATEGRSDDRLPSREEQRYWPRIFPGL